MRVICDRDFRRFTSLNLVVKVQAERAGPMGLRREDGSPLGPTPGYGQGSVHDSLHKTYSPL